MKAVVQRVRSASVTVAGDVVGEIGVGLLVLLGVAPGDDEEEIGWLTDKILGLRIFPGDGKPMNTSVVDVGGELLVVSQFTLTADTSRGRRPSFATAAPPEEARTAYERLVALLRESIAVQTGSFGDEMQVALVNDGPVTFVLERDGVRKEKA